MRRIGTAFACLLAVAVVLWVAFHSGGHDWIWSGKQAAILELGVRGFGEFPYFSFYHNGGTYLIQDPQGILTSPAGLLSSVLPAEAVLRGLAGISALIGFTGMYAFLREKIGSAAAAFGSFSWTVSLGFLWHLIAGHDMFSWIYLFPVLLLCMERLSAAARPRDAVLLGLLGGVLLLGPGFHALFYVLFPGTALFLIVLTFSMERKRRPAFAGAMLLSAVVALLISLPKLQSWRALEMSRGTSFNDGVVSLRDAIYGLFATARASKDFGFGILGTGPGKSDRFSIWEVNTALTPIASVLALVGIASGRRLSPRLWCFSLLLVCAGLFVATDLWFWKFFNAFILSGVRAPSRFLLLASFGLAVLAGLGLNRLLSLSPFRQPNARVSVVTIAFALAFGLCADWVRRAHQSDSLMPTAAPAISTALPQVVQPPLLRKYGDPLRGEISIDGGCPVGGGCPRGDSPEYPLDPLVRKVEGAANGSLPVLEGSHPGVKVLVTNQRLEVEMIPPHSELLLNLRWPSLGFENVPSDPESPTAVRSADGLISVRNRGEALGKLSLTVKPPVRLWLWCFSGVIFLAAVVLGLAPFCWRCAGPAWIAFARCGSVK